MRPEQKRSMNSLMTRMIAKPTNSFETHHARSPCPGLQSLLFKSLRPLLLLHHHT
jgi:hypothetical protein